MSLLLGLTLLGCKDNYFLKKSSVEIDAPLIPN